MRFRNPGITSFWLPWIIQSLKAFYYKIRYGIKFDYLHSQFPHLGNNQPVSIIMKGVITDVVAQEDIPYDLGTLHKGDFVRIIPNKYIKGVTIEVWKNDKCCSRDNVSIDELASIFGNSNPIT